MATSESNRALPPYQGGPFDRLGRGQRKAEVSIFQAAKPARAFKARCRAGGAPSIYFSEESGGLEPQRVHAHPLSGRSLRPWQVHSPRASCSPARCEQAGDGRGRRTRIPASLTPTRFPAGASRLAGSSSEEGGRIERLGVTRASGSNGARRLAGSPSVRWEGVEPSRQKTRAPGARAATSYATSA